MLSPGHRLIPVAFRLFLVFASVPMFVPGRAGAQEPGGISKFDAWAGPTGILHVRWITREPSKGRVDYGVTAALGKSTEEDAGSLRGTTNNRDSGIGWASNHRADITGIKTWPVHVRISAVGRESGEFRGPIQLVTAPVQPQGTVERAVIPVALHPGDWKLDSLPITIGVPFPRSALAHATNLRLLCDDDEVVCQTTAVSCWRQDNSIKWLRLEALLPRSAKAITVEFGTAVRSSKSRHPMDRPSIAPQPTWQAVLTAADGTVHTARAEEALAEERGPVKTVIRYRGHHMADDGTKLGAFTIREIRWSQSPFVRVDYTFENDNTTGEFTALRSLYLNTPRLDDSAGITVETGDGEIMRLRQDERVWQREDFEWVHEPGERKGRRLPGVIHIGDRQRVMIRDFWRQWPASIERREKHLALGLCPVLPSDTYAGRPDEDKLYYNIRDGLHTFRQGFSKTWEVWVITDGTNDASGVGERPVASLPASWYEQSGVFGNLAVSVRALFPGYDETLAQAVERYPAGQDSRREYGMMNFGDWYGERIWNWGNLEYDLGHGFLTQYMRSGNPAFFRRAEECVRHQRDVDTRHYARDPRRIGQQWTHSMGHTAGYYPKEYKKMKVYASPGWSDNRGHIWAQGMFEHYLLGGDFRSWETACLVADWAAGPQTTNFRFGNAREPGWMTKLVMSAYQATDDLYYLNAATIMMDALRRRSEATGNRGFNYHRLGGGHCRCPDGHKHYGEAGFMLGVLMTGMKMVVDETGNEQIADDIVRIARFIIDTMWVPDRFAFRYTSCPETTISSGAAWIMMQGLAYAARRADDREMADVCRQALAAAWQSLPASGKSAGYVLCSSAQALAEVGRLPGVGFAEYRERIEKALRSPSRRPLPTAVPNPDFEENIQGWPSRGVAITRDTTVKHSGQASLKISGSMMAQNEYVNTRYNSSGSPFEICWLEPGQTVRLTAWLRVDKAIAGTVPPSLRLAFRDETGTRGGAATNTYDLTRLGTWQALSAEIEIPEWNTRNYIALNTNTRAEVDVVMYLDDVSLTSVDDTSEATYINIRLDPDKAICGDGAEARNDPALPGNTRLRGPGTAVWQLELAQSGKYHIWAILEAGIRLSGLRLNDTLMPVTEPPKDATWVRLGAIELAAGPLKVTLHDLPPGPMVGRVVLTTNPGSNQ